MSETLLLAGLQFQVRRSARRLTVSVTVDRGGELVLHAPDSTSRDDLAGWMQTKLLWVHRKLALKEATAPQVRSPEYVTGQTFAYLGRRYRLQVVPEQEEPLRCDGSRFLLRREARPGEVHFRKWYIGTGKPWLVRRVEALTRRTGLAPARLVVPDLGYRWGSCGRGATLCVNWRALQLPVRLVDYVLVHELCHLAEPGHGPQFWAAVERAQPDWNQRQEELHRKASEIYWCAVAMAP